MSERIGIDNTILFKNGKPRLGEVLYLGWDRASAMADFIVRDAGTLEVPISHEIPEVKFLPSDMPKHPRKHDKYYADGGNRWPDRYLVKRAAIS